jgi:hypothetical protein
MGGLFFIAPRGGKRRRFNVGVSSNTSPKEIADPVQRGRALQLVAPNDARGLP